MLDNQDEIDILEGAKSNLEYAIEDLKDSPYHSHLIEGLESNIAEIDERLDELHGEQDEQWKEEVKELNNEYWGNRL